MFIAFRGHFVYAPNQGDATIHCYAVCHWLCTYTKWPQNISFLRLVVPMGTHYIAHCVCSSNLSVVDLLTNANITIPDFYTWDQKQPFLLVCFIKIDSGFPGKFAQCVQSERKTKPSSNWVDLFINAISKASFLIFSGVYNGITIKETELT